MAALFFVKYTKKGMSIDERDGKCTWCICTSIYFAEGEGCAYGGLLRPHLRS